MIKKKRQKKVFNSFYNIQHFPLKPKHITQSPTLEFPLIA